MRPSAPSYRLSGMRHLGSLLAAAFMLLSAASCSLFGFRLGGTVVAVVGDVDITYEMVAVRAQALQGNPRAAANPQATAFAQLIQGYLSAQIAGRYGDMVSDESVIDFWAHQQLPAAVQAVTATASRALVMQALARPDHATWLLDALFHSRPDLQQEPADLAARIHTELLAAPETFDAVAAREGLEVDRVWLGPTSIRSATREAAGATTGPTYSKEEVAQAGELYRAFAALQAGEIYPRPLSTPDAFQVFRIERRRGTELGVAVITVAKMGLDEWFVSQAANIPIELRDRELSRTFIQTVPWVYRLNIVNTDDYPEFFLPR